MSKNDRHTSPYIPFRCSPETAELISELAMQKRASKSEVLRYLVDEGLRATGIKPSEEHLYNVVKEAVEEVTKPSVERLAAISAKATQLDAAAFFMYLYMLTRDGSPEEQAKIQETVESARRLGIQYLKLRDKDIDSFLRDGAGEIIYGE